MPFGCDRLVVDGGYLELHDRRFCDAAVLAVVPRFLALIDSRAEGHHRQVFRVEIGSEVAREVGQFFDGAEKFSRRCLCL